MISVATHSRKPNGIIIIIIIIVIFIFFDCIFFFQIHHGGIMGEWEALMSLERPSTYLSSGLLTTTHYNYMYIYLYKYIWKFIRETEEGMMKSSRGQVSLSIRAGETKLNELTVQGWHWLSDRLTLTVIEWDNLTLQHNILLQKEINILLHQYNNNNYQWMTGTVEGMNMWKENPSAHPPLLCYLYNCFCV